MVRKKPPGLASEEQIRRLENIFGEALRKRKLTFDEAAALFERRFLENELVEKVKEITSGSDYVELEVFIPKDASIQDFIDFSQWQFIGYQQVLRILVTMPQEDGRLPVVLTKAPTSYLKKIAIDPGWTLDVDTAFEIYKEKRLKPDLIAQAIINKDPSIARDKPNITIWHSQWPEGERFYSLGFDSRGTKPQIVASYAGDRVLGDVWLVGVPI